MSAADPAGGAAAPADAAAAGSANAAITTGPGTALTPAPALAQALAAAAIAWSAVRSGHSLDRALEIALEPARQIAPRAPRAGRRERHEQALRSAGQAPAAPVSAGAAARLAGAVRDLSASALRRAGQIDFLLGELVHRPPDPAVSALLAVALAQLLARSYAEFTVVDQAVAASRATPRTAAAAGLVNAVLRGFLRRREALETAAAADPARRYNVPPWWLRRIQAEYGARAPALLAAQLEEPPMILRVNIRRATVAQMLGEMTAQRLAVSQVGPVALWLHRPVPVERVPGFAAGLVSVQDAGAQLAAPLLELAAGMRVLDVCAAPGGKTAHLLELADCHVDAVEVDPKRARRIDANLQRLGLAGARARVLVADALLPASYWDGTPYDRIVLDAPCTASGVVRRHPDVVLLRRESDVAKLATQQAKMLQTLWPLLAPAGRLLYVVCSVFAEEGRRQIAAFLQRQPGARQIRLPGDDAAGLQLLPCTTAGTAPWTSAASADAGSSQAMARPVLHDGFFYALLEKT